MAVERQTGLYAQLKTWLTKLGSAVGLLALFAGKLDIGPIASGLIDIYEKVRDVLWKPLSLFIEIDPGLKNFLTFACIFLFAFLFRGDRRNNFAAICALGSMAAVAAVTCVITIGHYLGIVELAEWVLQRYMLLANEWVPVDNDDDMIVVVTIVSAVICVVSALATVLIFQSSRLLAMLPACVMLISLPGFLIAVGAALYFAGMVAVLLIMLGLFYWIIAFFLPQAGLAIQKLAVHFLDEEQVEYAMVAVAIIPFTAGAGLLALLGMKHYWQEWSESTVEDMAMFDKRTRWLTIEEMKSYYKPVAEVAALALLILLVSKLVADSLS